MTRRLLLFSALAALTPASLSAQHCFSAYRHSGMHRIESPSYAQTAAQGETLHLFGLSRAISLRTDQEFDVVTRATVQGALAHTAEGPLRAALSSVTYSFYDARWLCLSAGSAVSFLSRPVEGVSHHRTRLLTPVSASVGLWLGGASSSAVLLYTSAGVSPHLSWTLRRGGSPQYHAGLSPTLEIGTTLPTRWADVQISGHLNDPAYARAPRAELSVHVRRPFALPSPRKP